MTIEIKTSTLAPVRNTYAHIERRFGDKPATRYQEATYDVQSESYFHYRPLWQPDKELNDPSRTAITMEDWYDFKDPRQYYYGSYVQQRAKMQENAENNYAFFEKRNLSTHLSDDVQKKIIQFLLPLRHVEHTANLNNVYASAYGYGTAITQAFLYNGMDRLAIAQYLSRIGLILDGNTGESLQQAKSSWMEDSLWQEMRRYCEQTTTVDDWFEVFIAQDVVLDSLVYHLFYELLDRQLSNEGASDLGILTEFMRQWNKDTTRWVDSVLKVAIAKSDDNKRLIENWISHWLEKSTTALLPISNTLLGDSGLQESQVSLNKRLNKVGLFK